MSNVAVPSWGPERSISGQLPIDHQLIKTFPPGHAFFFSSENVTSNILFSLLCVCVRVYLHVNNKIPVSQKNNKPIKLSFGLWDHFQTSVRD